MAKFSNKDFSIDALPTNRKEQFFDLLKHRFDSLFTIGLFLLLFTIPFFAVLTAKQVILYQAYISFGSDMEKYRAFVFTNTLVFDAVYIPTFIIIGLGFAGIFQIFKKMCWGEGIFFLKDYVKGLKSNWLRFTIIILIFGLLHLISDYFKNAFGGVVGYLPFALEILIFPSFFIMMSMNTIYKNKFTSIMADSIIMFLKRPLTGLAFTALPLLISFVYMIGVPVAIFVIYIVLFLLIFPIYGIMFYLYCLSGFDKFSNAKFYPNIYQKGLAQEFKKTEETKDEKVL